jgi:hypothetical protein
MLSLGSSQIQTLHLSLSPSPHFKPPCHKYYEPISTDEVDTLRSWIHSLDDGKILYARGRDICRNSEGNFADFSAWETGLVLKFRRRLFLLWEDYVESILIDGCNFLDQLHFDTIEEFVDDSCPTEFDHKRIVLCHGFCYDDGPNYAFLKALGSSLSTIGFHISIPDFRPRYHSLPLCMMLRSYSTSLFDLFSFFLLSLC